MKDRLEIRLSGSGGQGLLTAGIILAYALGIGEGKNVVQTQSYGPEARGGASRSDVVVSNGEIYNPKPSKLDILLCLNQESCDAFSSKLKEDGILIIDTDLVKEPQFENFVGAPFTKLAIEKFKTPVTANIIALGFLCGYIGLAKGSSLELAIESRFNPKHVEINKKAAKLGYELGKTLQKEGKKKETDARKKK
ncbi:MAG: 2-oxoacid:acceptor oxidoreductase family protein [bacterium]